MKDAETAARGAGPEGSLAEAIAGALEQGRRALQVKDLSVHELGAASEAFERLLAERRQDLPLAPASSLVALLDELTRLVAAATLARDEAGCRLQAERQRRSAGRAYARPDGP